MSSVFILKPVDLLRAKCFCFELFWREARGVCGKARVQPLVIAACLFVLSVYVLIQLMTVVFHKSTNIYLCNTSQLMHLVRFNTIA